MYESFAAQRAAERIDEPGSRETVHDVLADCDKLLANPDSAGMIHGDTSFHTAIMDLSGNAIMAAEWRRLRRSRYRIGFLRSLKAEEILVSAQQHKETLFAILDGDAELASATAAKHVRLTNGRIQRLSNEEFDAIFNPAGQPVAIKSKSVGKRGTKAA
jgi:DNA-binding GntR family transcriptional regulator